MLLIKVAGGIFLVGFVVLACYNSWESISGWFKRGAAAQAAEEEQIRQAFGQDSEAYTLYLRLRNQHNQPHDF